MGAVRKRNVAKIQSTYVEQQEFAEISTARKRKLLVRRLSLFSAFAVFVAYFMISSILSQAKILDGKVSQKKQLDQQLTELKNQRDSLKEDIVNLNNDDYVGKLARKELFFSNKGEIIFNIPDNKKEKSTGN
jgi:cell division protein DivIC